MTEMSTTPDYAGLADRLTSPVSMSMFVRQTDMIRALLMEREEAATALRSQQDRIRTLLESNAALERERTNLIETKREQIGGLQKERDEQWKRADTLAQQNAYHKDRAEAAEAAAARLVEAEREITGYQAERERWINYTTDLQRIIEALCNRRGLPEPVSTARHHYEMAREYLSTKAEAALARAEANAGKPVAGMYGEYTPVTVGTSTAHPAPQPSGPVEVTPETVHPSHDVRDEDISGIISDPVCQRCRISAYGPQKDRLLKPCRADEHGINPDDEAVDRFALAMKAKLKWEREERGRYGWNDPSVCSEEYLSRLLIEHLAKGNEGNFEDIANFCMMLHQRGAHPQVLASALTAGKPEQAVASGWTLVPEDLLDSFPEINPSNYDHDDACALNSWGVEVVMAALPAAPTAGKPEQPKGEIR